MQERSKMNKMNLAGLRSRLSVVGQDFSSLVESTRAIYLFGSRAENVARDDSDWDLLCVGNCQSLKSRFVDLVFISEQRARSDDWLGSELASHVASYGELLHGDPIWVKRKKISTKAVEKKREKIARRVSIVSPWWASFAVSVQKKHIRLIANDLSRLNYLIAGEPVPPTPMLDSTCQDGFCRLVEKFKMENSLPPVCIQQLQALSITDCSTSPKKSRRVKSANQAMAKMAFDSMRSKLF